MRYVFDRTSKCRNHDFHEGKRPRSFARVEGIKSAFLLLKTAEGVGEVTDDMCIKALQKMAKQRKDSLDIYEQQGREDLAVIERSELTVVESFYPPK